MSDKNWAVEPGETEVWECDACSQPCYGLMLLENAPAPQCCIINKEGSANWHKITIDVEVRELQPLLLFKIRKD